MILRNNTKIRLYPSSGERMAAIVISDIPSWLSDNKIELRFAPLPKSAILAKFARELNEQKAGLIEELGQEFDKLPEEEKKDALPFYEELIDG